MHTFLKRSNLNYEIGMWLRSPQGFEVFQPQLIVSTLKDALIAVNVLNGGHPIAAVNGIPDFMSKCKIEEYEDESDVGRNRY